MSFKQPKYAFYTCSLNDLDKGVDDDIQYEQIITKPITRPSISNIHSYSFAQWELKQRGNLENICEFVYQSIVNQSENGYFVIINKTLLYNQLTQLAYKTSRNTSKTFKINV